MGINVLVFCVTVAQSVEDNVPCADAVVIVYNVMFAVLGCQGRSMRVRERHGAILCICCMTLLIVTIVQKALACHVELPRMQHCLQKQWRLAMLPCVRL